jgi:hypothetical protein
VVNENYKLLPEVILPCTNLTETVKLLCQSNKNVTHVTLNKKKYIYINILKIKNFNFFFLFKKKIANLGGHPRVGGWQRTTLGLWAMG